MKKKIGVLSLSILCLAILISCEEDFSDIATNIVDNNKFITNQIDLEIEIEEVGLESVRADNIGAVITEYWLGVYNNPNYKKIESSFVTQIGLASNLITKDVSPAVDETEQDQKIDSTFILDKVILKLPYTATSTGVFENLSPKFRLDSILGDTLKPVSLKVFQNQTFLNTLDPSNPAESNSYQSNHAYVEGEVLSDDFAFTPSALDTMLVVERHHANGSTFESQEKLGTVTGPFLTIPLNFDKMKALFWDKFYDSEFSATEEFNNYFRGVIVKAEGEDGSMVPLALTGAASLEFFYTITRQEIKEGEDVLTHKDTIPSKYTFPITGVKNSIYKMSPASGNTPANNFVLQGTAGTNANVKIKGVNLDRVKTEDPENPILKHEDKDVDQNGYLDLEELASIKDSATDELGLLVNDAKLNLYVNTAVSPDKNILPQNLLLYTTDEENNSRHLTDIYREPDFYGGNLVLKEEEETPDFYSFRITDHLANIINGNVTDFNDLILKVFNLTDNPVSQGILDTSVSTYNWNPRGVTLFDNDEQSHGAKRAVLRLTYSERK